MKYSGLECSLSGSCWKRRKTLEKLGVKVDSVLEHTYLSLDGIIE